ncbi:MAG TPA: type III-B CRISPR module-associated protein Cmr5 [Moorella mulderi]|nr:type III-B CRISPR module-associated protein Cmr5 [Moorella mulderi]
MALSGIEGGRARFAYACAEEGSRKENYRSHVRKLPSLIKTNGLGAALAFVSAKAEKDETYRLIRQHIERWLQTRKLIRQGEPLVKQVISLELADYRAVTEEVLAFSRWLTRFADALCGGE